MLAPAFQLLGLILDLCGALLLAHAYLTGLKTEGGPWSTASARLRAIVSALWRGDRAKTAARASTLTEENRLLTLQGAGLLVLGFALQGVGFVLSILS